jgi:cytochrome c-type biogenesis protein CcmE
MRKNLPKILVTAAIAVAVVGFLVYSSLASAQHYKMVDDLMKAPDQWVGKEMKVHGWVEPGSIHEWIADQQTVRTFILEKGGKKIKVSHKGPKPDTFKDQSEVVATGLVSRQGNELVVEATELSAKCPSKYEGSQNNKKLAEQPVFK